MGGFLKFISHILMYKNNSGGGYFLLFGKNKSAPEILYFKEFDKICLFLKSTEMGVGTKTNP